MPVETAPPPPHQNESAFPRLDEEDLERLLRDRQQYQDGDIVFLRR